MAENKEGQSLITFRTDGVWNIQDIQSFVSAVASFYTTVYGLTKYRRASHEVAEETLYMHKRYLEDMMEYAPHPYMKEMMYLWEKMYHNFEKHMKEGYPYKKFMKEGYPYPPMPFPGMPNVPEIPRLSAISFIEDIKQSMIPDYQLQVYRVKMESPGDWSFSGLSDVVREFRELIKDLWFRNSQEKRKGELEIEAISRVLRDRYHVPPKENQKITGILTKDKKALENLEKEGKLLPIPEHIDNE